jgi:hypothetical protein
MSDRWVNYFCSIGEFRASVIVNVGVESVVRQASVFLVNVRLIYKSPNEDGLPTQDEYEQVCQVEDDILDFVSENDSLYVGRITVNGIRDYFIYTSKPKEFWEAEVETIFQRHGYEFMLSYKEDTNHSDYFELLYPGDDDWRVIADMDVINNACDHGDNCDLPRRVDHWAYFKTRSAG